MNKVINGQALAEKIKDEIVKEILGEGGNKKNKIPPTPARNACASDAGGPLYARGAVLNRLRPNLAIVLVGNREDSKLYVALKEKEAKKVGIDTHLYKLTEECGEAELLEVIDYLNSDDLIDGILVQLPLPAPINADNIVKAISPEKDVDGFHPDNLKILLSSCDHEQVIPPVIKVVLEILASINFNLEGKQVCIIANSDIFGISMAKVVGCRGAKVSVVKADDKDLSEKTKKADVLITAVGQPKLIKKGMVKKDAVVIDIGIMKHNKEVCGDVDFKNVKNKVSFITPVPGGVGPLTIAMAFKNVLELYKRRYKKK